MKKKPEENSVWQQDGKFMIVVYYGAERLHKYIVKADSYSKAIQKIVNDSVNEWPDIYDADSEIKFVREIYDELK